MMQVHIVIKDGFIDTAFAEDPNVEVVVYDLDCSDPEELNYIEGEVLGLRRTLNEIDVY
jgi:hypothetical protein